MSAMTASEYVAAVDCAVADAAGPNEHGILSLVYDLFDRDFLVYKDGQWALSGSERAARMALTPAYEPVMCVRLTPENTASPVALKRALLRSAITVRENPIVKGYTEARLVSGGHVRSYMARGISESEAIDALLDSLLSVSEGAGT